jgi:hypothetical protein
MRRAISLIVVIAAAALFAVPAAVADKGNNNGHFTVCITGTDGLHQDVLNIIGNTGLPSEFQLSNGQATQVIKAGQGNIGNCDEGSGDTFTVCVTNTQSGFDLGTQDLSSEDAQAVVGAGQGYFGPCHASSVNGGPAGIFLCYSTFQTTPSVWPVPEAAKLLAGGGYWQAYAIKGNVAGGTNVGGYHLVCNVASGQSVGGSFSDEGGVGTNANDHAAINGALGWYPVISG